jgi:hypothetical protein
MAKYGFKAVFFVMMSVNRPNYLSKEQIKTWQSRAMKVQHTWDHIWSPNMLG